MFKAHGGAERERRRDGKEGGTEREEGGMGRPRLFDPIITSGTTARDQIRRKKRRGRTRTATPRIHRLAGLRIQTYNFEL